jgi:precorrin-8X/cobalt-precorrin-8 methylmutase
MSDMRRVTEAGRLIEDASFALIDAEADAEADAEGGRHAFSPAEWQVVRRVIHATADLDFTKALTFHPLALEAGVAALRRGASVICDVQMIAAGLSPDRLATFGSSVSCFIAEDEVIRAAREANCTRAAEAMRRAHRLRLLDGAVIAIGNAPTALAALQRLVCEERAAPALVVGVPVGFVGAVEAKEAALALPVPHVVARGRKGGSPAAVAIVNALLALAAEGAA